MKLKFTGSVQNEHVMSVEADTESQIRSFGRLRLELDKADLGDGMRQSVLHAVVTDERGMISHIHFSLGLNHQGRVVGQVTAVGTNDDVSRKVVASWLKTRANEAEQRPEYPTLDDPDTAAEFAEEKHTGFDD